MKIPIQLWGVKPRSQNVARLAIRPIVAEMRVDMKIFSHFVNVLKHGILQ
jgi:hypothetical protein